MRVRPGHSSDHADRVARQTRGQGTRAHDTSHATRAQATQLLSGCGGARDWALEIERIDADDCTNCAAYERFKTIGMRTKPAVLEYLGLLVYFIN